MEPKKEKHIWIKKEEEEYLNYVGNDLDHHYIIKNKYYVCKKCGAIKN